MASPKRFAVKSQAEHRDDILRTIRLGLIARGVSNPNVTPNSDYYVIAEGLANELAVVGANNVVSADQVLPDTADFDGLKRLAEPYGLAPRAATGSLGFFILDTSASTTVTAGSQLIDGSGLRYEATIGGTYADGDQVPVAAIDTGSATNLAAGETLRFTGTPPAYATDQVTIDTGGLTNGADEESAEDFRARFLAFLQDAPRSGNPAHLAAFAEQASASVQKGFVYPAIEGPGTAHIAATAAPTSSSKSRVIASALMSGTIEPAVVGNTPKDCRTIVTTVADVNADVAFGLALPAAPTAAQPGPGGGWLDGSPWPTVDGASYFRVTVTAVTSSTQFTVDAQPEPVANVSRICWLSPTTWKLYQATVTSVSGTAGAWVITVDNAFTGIATGCYIWPAAQNAQAYVDAAFAAFALLGPGEKTTNASALIRGYRHPTPAKSWSPKVASQMLAAIGDAGDEVEAAGFFHRTDGTSTVTGSAGSIEPQVPGTVTDPPNIFVPRHIAFYPI